MVQEKIFICVIPNDNKMERYLIKDISRGLEISETRLLEESVESFLDRELRKAFSEIEKLKEKYLVETPTELGEKIKEGKVKEHPTWEELIEWENLEKRIEEVQGWRKKTHIPA